MGYGRAREPDHAALVAVPGGLAWSSSYDAGLVAAFKQSIPPEARKWQPDAKRWIVDAQYGAQVARLTEAYLGIVLIVPEVAHVATGETRLLKLEYLGATKARGSGDPTAFGWVDGGWNLIVPEAILRTWFEAVPQRPDEKPTLFAVLAVKQTASTDEIRSAFRRLAIQWHPDRCHEVNAAEVFKAIQHAYEVLSSETMRRKYVAGLALEASLVTQKRSVWDDGHWTPLAQQYGYRSPLRCGWLLAEGQETLGRFVVSRLLQWEDVVNSQGQTMVSSWVMGQDKPEIIWQ